MCIGVPMQIVEAGPCVAWCSGPAGRVAIDLALVGPQAPGTWLLTFMGAARAVLDAQAAADITAALAALQGALDGDVARIDAAFPDLVDRIPQLPEHLRIKEAPR